MVRFLTANLSLHDPGLDRRIMWFLMIVGIITSMVISTGDPGSLDTSRRLQVTRWIWTNESQIAEGLDKDPFWSLPGRNGKHYAPYGIGQSLAMLPGDMVATVISKAAPERLRDKIHMAIVSLMTFPLINGCALVLSFLLLRRLRFTPGIALLSTLLVNFATTFLQYSQVDQENNLLVLVAVGGLSFGLSYAHTGKRRDVVLASVFLGFGLLIRSTTVLLDAIITVLIVYECMVVADERQQTGIVRDRCIGALTCGLPILLVFLGCERGYNWFRFGSVTGTYIGIQAQVYAALGTEVPAGYPFGFPFLSGFLRPLIDPRKSVFIYDPLLILPFGLLLLYARHIERRFRVVLMWLIASLFITIAFYARSYWWHGDVAWGPRHESVPVFLLCLVGSAIMLRHYVMQPSIVLKRYVKLLVVLAVSTQLLSLTLDANIEILQCRETDLIAFVPIMRLVNLIALCTGHFESWNLDEGLASVRAIAHQYPPLLVIRLFKYLPVSIAVAGCVLWCGLVTALVAAVVSWCRAGFRLARESDHQSTHGGISPPMSSPVVQKPGAEGAMSPGTDSTRQ